MRAPDPYLEALGEVREPGALAEEGASEGQGIEEDEVVHISEAPDEPA